MSVTVKARRFVLIINFCNIQKTFIYRANQLFIEYQNGCFAPVNLLPQLLQL